VNHVRINAPVDSDSRTGGSTHSELDKLQAQLDQLRARLLYPEPTEQLGEDEVTLARLVKEILRVRRRREKIFGGDLFGEPAWDILLELYVAERSQQKLSVSSVCYVSAVPATTALRWIQRLEKDGWIERVDDPLDGRRSWVQLTKRASAEMREYLAQVAIRPI